MNTPIDRYLRDPQGFVATDAEAKEIAEELCEGWNHSGQQMIGTIILALLDRLK